jgi:hypothetical protein
MSDYRQLKSSRREDSSFRSEKCREVALVIVANRAFSGQRL